MIAAGCTPEDILLDENETKEKEEPSEEEQAEEEKQELEEINGVEEFEMHVEISVHTLQDLAGNKVEVPEDLEEKSLVKFWQSDCPICLKEMDEVQKFYDRIKDKDNKGFYSVNIMENPEDIEAYLQNEGYDFPVLFDTDGEMAQDYQVMGVPVAYVVDNEKNVLGVYPGPMKASDMEEVLETD